MTPEESEQAEHNADALSMVESMPMQQFPAFPDDAFPPEAREEFMELSRTAS